MPKVINPRDKDPKKDSTFVWDMEGVFYSSSKVIVGSAPGSDNIYVGTEFSRRRSFDEKDPNVRHPRNGQTCFTRAKYRKSPQGAWYTTNSVITSFKSMP